MKEIGARALADGDTLTSEAAWATVRIDGKDWGRVLSVGRMGGRVIACKCLPPMDAFDLQSSHRSPSREISSEYLPSEGFVHEHALILYVYLSSNGSGNDDGGGEVEVDLAGTGVRLKAKSLY